MTLNAIIIWRDIVTECLKLFILFFPSFHPAGVFPFIPATTTLILTKWQLPISCSFSSWDFSLQKIRLGNYKKRKEFNWFPSRITTLYKNSVYKNSEENRPLLYDSIPQAMSQSAKWKLFICMIRLVKSSSSLSMLN